MNQIKSKNYNFHTFFLHSSITNRQSGIRDSYTVRLSGEKKK